MLFCRSREGAESHKKCTDLCSWCLKTWQLKQLQHLRVTTLRGQKKWCRGTFVVTPSPQSTMSRWRLNTHETLHLITIGKTGSPATCNVVQPCNMTTWCLVVRRNPRQIRVMCIHLTSNPTGVFERSQAFPSIWFCATLQ